MIIPPTARTRTPKAEGGKAAQPDAYADPTVVAPAGTRARGTTAAEAEAPARTRLAARPTVIPGVERKRIAAELSDIKKLSPLAKPAVLEQTLRLIQSFVVESARDRQAVLWGHRLQQDYSDLVSRTLELSQADVLKRSTGYVGRMTDILGSIDIEAVCGAPSRAGVFGQYFKKTNSRIDTAGELDTARIELDQLVRLMGEALEQLLSFKETLEQHARRIEDIGDEAEASALAASFLSDHLRASRPPLSQRFLERGMSLTQTVAQIRSGASMREVQIEQPLRLIGAIQNVALVMVPGFLGSIAALTTMLDSNRKLTPTEAGELAYQLRNILQQLKE
ncbi:hypothetical protein [Mesorhizobium metallidurans]|uniref:hypothetical protein n=1 Tax=Mesorhizobium metallidurans TaxID=489722 RepID=UPI001FCA7D39|nr:hypothetical protein [Mesorhizobium metallidurans]